MGDDSPVLNNHAGTEQPLQLHLQELPAAAAAAASSKLQQHSTNSSGSGRAGKNAPVQRQGPCGHCKTPYSPQWRKGPRNKPVLCNACGIRYLRNRHLGRTVVSWQALSCCRRCFARCIAAGVVSASRWCTLPQRTASHPVYPQSSACSVACVLCICVQTIKCCPPQPQKKRTTVASVKHHQAAATSTDTAGETSMDTMSDTAADMQGVYKKRRTKQVRVVERNLHCGPVFVLSNWQEAELLVLNHTPHQLCIRVCVCAPPGNAHFSHINLHVAATGGSQRRHERLQLQLRRQRGQPAQPHAAPAAGIQRHRPSNRCLSGAAVSVCHER